MIWSKRKQPKCLFFKSAYRACATKSFENTHSSRRIGHIFKIWKKVFFSTSLREIVRGETRIFFVHDFFLSFLKTLVCKNTYLSVKKAFSVRPEQAVATAITKVVIPKVEWIGTKAARKEAVADSQHNKSRKLKNPTTNCNRKSKLIFPIFFYFDCHYLR